MCRSTRSTTTSTTASSRFGAMFFADPVAGFASLRHATRPGGRLAFVCWQALAANQWLLVPGAALATVLPLPDLEGDGAPGMFAFADPDHTQRILSGAGWQDIMTTDRHTPILVGGPGLWTTPSISSAPGRWDAPCSPAPMPIPNKRALDAVRAALAPHVDDDGVRLDAAVWIVTARA